MTACKHHMLTHRFLIGCLMLIPAVTMLADTPGKRPNVVLVVIESLRSDHVGHYGYARDTTPALDALAMDGVTFRRAYASSGWTMPSVMSIMTSLPPSGHRAVGYQHKLFSGKTTLAAEFKRCGYRTAGIVANPTLSRTYGFHHGFDLYDDFTILALQTFWWDFSLLEIDATCRKAA